MSLTWREARRGDVVDVVFMLADDELGQGRESTQLAPYLAAFDAMQAEGGNLLIVGERDAAIVATYQLSIISGLSLRAARRAQVGSVRVSSSHRGEGLGAALMADAEARAAGCGLIQLTSNRSRQRAHAFYEGLGYTPSHVGFKRRFD